MKQIPNAHEPRNVVIKFTGPPCSGKTTLARFFVQKLEEIGIAVEANFEGDGPDHADTLTIRTGGRNLQRVYCHDRRPG